MRPTIRGAIGFGLAATFALGLWAPGRGAEAPSEVLPDDPTVGARLFVDKGCVRCHATSPEEVPGGERIGPDLGRIHRIGGFLEVAAALWNHASVMTDRMDERRMLRPSFTPQEMANLVAYLAAYMKYLQGVGEPGDPETGRRLFREKSCAACHALRQGGPGAGPSLEKFRTPLSPIAMAAAMWNHGPQMADRMARLGLPRPRFEANEMLDLLSFVQAEGTSAPGTYAYVEPGSPRRGAQVFETKGCRRCHAVNGVGGRAGPDLGRRAGDLGRSVGELAGKLWNHGPEMWAKARAMGLAVPRFTGPEMADVIAYLYYLSSLDPPGDPDRGGRLFFEKGCGQCHAVRGHGGQSGPDLALAPALGSAVEVVAAMWNHVPRMKRTMEQKKIAWPRFEPGEFRDVVAYLESQRP